MQRLETEKDSLRLQVSVLSDQVEAQSEKISDLERQLCEKKRELSKADEMLQLVSFYFQQVVSVSIELVCSL
jgi:chromosome segregation ATPase